MDKKGIGTDATIHDHIKTVREREYVRVNAARMFEPTELGLALVDAYDSMEQTMLALPELRAETEAGMKALHSPSFLSDNERLLDPGDR